MHTITAIIRVKPGCEAAMREALVDVTDYVRRSEPATLGFFVSQDAADPCVFTTYERFESQAAMDSHNGSADVAKFYAIARPLIEGDVTLIKSVEVAAKTG
jgi:quinol monooxygenase YgiN